MLGRVKVEEYREGASALRYRVAGASGDPVVLIHGLSGSWRWWRGQVPLLSARHRVYVIDLTGYGHHLAWRQRSLGVREDAALIARWLDAERLEHVTLIGHSMGGHIALHVAALAPGRVDRLVLACASGLLREHPVRAALHLPRAALTGRPSFLPVILADSARAGLPNLWRSVSRLLRDSVLDLLPEIRARTLVVWGARDALIPAALGRQLAASIPGAQYVELPRAGHVVMVDDPAGFNRAVLDFLAQGPGKQSPGKQAPDV
ncbi:alpha/beta fold hydrolase [Deinococcus wulumuqiensis]|uniref:alpha/beta fold hydrolase n=1 Tax=Deinococcus wulumuqiensis TaxID=980427 RepID=UPI00242C3E45|nr:alpha/beta fold hydrolase [Deinococcus wulumuqiensis]